MILDGADPAEWFDATGQLHPSVMLPPEVSRGATPSTVVEVRPGECVNGHPLTHPNVLVGWLPCTCAQPATGHRMAFCRTCRAEWFRPAHTDHSKAMDSWDKS